MAPETISRKEYTFKSDIYSIAMLMWEISSGQPPFSNCEHDVDFALSIINGMRPKVVSKTPLEYDPLKRPDIDSLLDKICELNLHYQNISSELTQPTQPEANNNFKTNYKSSKLLTSKVHQFENM